MTQRWLFHCVLYLILLIAVLSVTAPRTSFLSDEGALAIQAQSLIEDREWFHEGPSAQLERGDYFAYQSGSTRTDDGWLVFVKHPVHVLLVVGLSTFVGLVPAMYAISIFGALVAASAGWWLNHELRHRSPPLTFWIVGLSPVLIYSFVPLGHTIAVGLTGLATAAVLRHGRTLDWRWLAFAVGTLGTASLFRREAVLFGLALSIPALVSPKFGRLSDRLATALATTMGPFLAWRGEVLATRVIAGPEYRESLAGLTQDSEVNWLQSRGEGALSALLKAADSWTSPRAVGGLMVAGILLALIVLIRRHPRNVLTALAAGCAFTFVYGVWALDLQPSHVTGLVLAWPVAVFGIAQMRRREIEGRSFLLILVLITYTALVIGLQYSGADPGWGPRYLLLAVVPLSAVLSPALRRINLPHDPFDTTSLPATPGATVSGDRSTRARPYRMNATAFVVVLLLVVPAAAGTQTVRGVKAREAAMVDTVLRQDPKIVVSTWESLPRRAWRTSNSLEWYVVEPRELDTLLHLLRNQGVSEVVVVGPVDSISMFKANSRADWELVRGFAWEGMVVGTVQL